MSSNTLRGIGQEEEGEGRADTAAAAGVDNNQGEGSNSRARTDSAGSGGSGTSGSSDPFKAARALDAPVPGTRSLDASVPDATPSLDAKIPALASTLLGLAAPSLEAGGRGKGTVQGRDIHLPAEVNRAAGVHAVTDGIVATASATPELIVDSEPTLADPVRAATIAQTTADPASVFRADLNSHAPWYDQEPVGAHVYEDEKPSIVGRVAIGVAVAAGLSVVLFAIIRMNIQNSAADSAAPFASRPYKSTELVPPPARPALDPTAHTLAPPTATGAAVPVRGLRLDPPTDVRDRPKSPDSHGSTSPQLLGDEPNASSRVAGHLVAPPHATPPVRPAASGAAAKPIVRAVLAPRPNGSGEAASSAALARPPVAPAATAGQAPIGLAATPGPAGPPAIKEPPTLPAPSPAPSRTTASEKARVKAAYDPDSTLPLNVD
jgi:hypothetical protein